MVHTILFSNQASSQAAIRRAEVLVSVNEGRSPGLIGPVELPRIRPLLPSLKGLALG